MSSGRKQQSNCQWKYCFSCHLFILHYIEKRKHQSPPPVKSQIARRLEKLRHEQRRDLWMDTDDSNERSKQSKRRSANKSYIILSDSDEEEQFFSSSRQLRNAETKKKLSRISDENQSDATICLICSILSKLSPLNCCPEHLSLLKNHSHHQQQTTSSQWLPEHVLIVPLTDEIIERYLDPQQIYHLRTQASTSLIENKTSERNTSVSRTKFIFLSDNK